MSKQAQPFKIHFSSDDDSYSTTGNQTSPENSQNSQYSHNGEDNSDDSSLDFAIRKSQRVLPNKTPPRGNIRNQNSKSPIQIRKFATPPSQKSKSKKSSSQSQNTLNEPADASPVPNAVSIEQLSSEGDFTSNQLYSDESKSLNEKLKNNSVDDDSTIFSDHQENSPKFKVGAMSQDDPHSQNYSEEKSTSDKAGDEKDIRNLEESLNSESQIKAQEDVDDTSDHEIIEKRQEESEPVVPYSKAYFCTKSTKISLRSPLHFVFKLESVPLFFAQSQGMLAHHVYISTNENINVENKEYDYLIRISRNRTKFKLVQKGETNPKLTMRFSNDYGKEFGPRKITLIWHKTGIELKSRIPHKKRSGKWELNFRGKFLIVSQKNAIILNQDSNPSIYIRKIADQLLELEENDQYDPIDICSLAIASFVCPL